MMKLKVTLFGVLTAVSLGLVAPYASGQDFGKGLAAAQSGDFATALQEWRPLAEQGYASAQFSVGVMYKNGLGVPQDYKEAVKWYTLAADQGHASAQYNLGVMYENGKGVPQDYKEAAKWYRLAADQGHASAQYNLGVMYGKGDGVLQDYIRAHMWFNIAAANGNDNARENRDIVAKKMTPEQIEKAQALAKECLRSKYKDC